MIDDIFLVGCFGGHFVADHIGQTKWMRDNKAKSWKAFISQAIEYAVVFTVIVMVTAGLEGYFSPSSILGICMLVSVVHVALTISISMIEEKASASGKMQMAWVLLGLNQFIHATTFVLAYLWMVQD